MKRKSTKVIAIVACVIVMLGCLSAQLYLHCVKNGADYVNFDKTKLHDTCSALTVLDCNGQEIREPLFLNNNRQIPLAALNKYTYMAFVAVEDKRFFDHSGIDLKRVVGATVHNVGSGSFKEGASTISQQLIKNTHLTNNKTIKRKVNEMLLALELEKHYTKEEILQIYLNTIYFGRNAYGIENAANVYFDKSAADLTVAESATLAGMIKAPNTYAPDKNAEKCKMRRNTVLKLMLEQNVIDEATYTAAAESNVEFRPYTNKGEKTYLHQVIKEACRLLNMTEAQLYAGGFVIETYLEPAVQDALLKAAAADATTNTDGTLCDLACVVCNNTGGVSGCYFRGDNAYFGRQIGSTAKPLAVYTPALCENMITQASPVLDEATDFSGYKPSNVNGYIGWTTIKNAVTKSLNVPAVKTLNSLGLATAEKYLQKLGFEEKQNLSLALGNIEGGMTAIQLAKCYATLANDGVCNETAYIKNIYNANGEIYSRKHTPAKVYDSKAVYLMTDMLKNAVTEGTAKGIGRANVITAAKTGTVGNSEGNTDALVAGYTTQHTYVFWYSGNLPNKVNGGTAPCSLGAKVLSEMYRENKPHDFPLPQGIAEIAVDRDSLYNRQLVRAAQNGEIFLFDSANCPAPIAEKYDYKLSANIVCGKVFLQLPQAEKGYFWKIFRRGDCDTEIKSTAVTDGTYYAELWNNGTRVYTTPPLQVNAKVLNSFGVATLSQPFRCC